MKKILAAVITAAMAVSMVACNVEVEETTAVTGAVETKSEGVMTYDEYDKAALDSSVVIEAYVQATQSWWEDKITVYAADKDGAYFIYELACPEADAAKLVAGQKIKVTGTKAEWSGEVEIVDATFELEDGNYVAPAFDATSLLGTDDLIKHQNQLVSFKDMTVKSVEYKNGEPGDDIYVTFTKGNADYSFCLEYYLNGKDEAFYNLVGGLQAGQTVDVEGYLYWYEGANTHITAVTVK